MSDGDWLAVAAEVRQRMTARKMSTAELARRTALSPATIRGIRKGNGPSRESTLATLAAGLGWPLSYPREVADGKPPYPPPVVALTRIEQKLDALLTYLG
jgi:transcriptional regulator with XRE-family HTH domain